MTEFILCFVKLKSPSSTSVGAFKANHFVPHALKKSLAKKQKVDIAQRKIYFPVVSKHNVLQNSIGNTVIPPTTSSTEMFISENAFTYIASNSSEPLYYDIATYYSKVSSLSDSEMYDLIVNGIMMIVLLQKPEGLDKLCPI